MLSHGFDHADAVASFLEAARRDPECAACYWGAAFALGPNINAPISDDAVPRAYTYSRKALSLADRVSEREQALIRALARRYGPDPDVAVLHADAERRFRHAWARANRPLPRSTE